jgi:hypothetical protein
MAAVKLAFGVVLLCLATAGTSRATAVIDINFEGDTVGQAPATSTTVGDPMTVPSAIGGFTYPTQPDPGDIPPTAASGTVEVINASGSNMAKFTTAPTNAELGALYMDVNGFNLAAQQIQMSFDVNILDAPTMANTQVKHVQGGPDAGIVLGMNAFAATGLGEIAAFRFAAAPTSANGGIFSFRSPDNSTLIPFFNYTEGTLYSLKIVADYSTGKLDAYVNGNPELTDYAFWTGGQAGVVTNEYFFHLNGELNNANSVALDNISSFSAVPEAGAFLLGGLACAAAAVGAVSRKYFGRAA